MHHVPTANPGLPKASSRTVDYLFCYLVAATHNLYQVPLNTSASVSLVSMPVRVCVRAFVLQTKKFYKLVKKAAKDKTARRGVKEVRQSLPITL